jgi:hypothetical protein
MTLLDVLRHQWHQRTRSPTFGRSLIGGLLLLLAAAYFGSLFVAVGWFFPEIVAEVAPGQDPLRLLNEFLLYGAVGLVPMRFFLQRSAGSDVRPYLHLPLRRPQVVRILQGLSSLSLLNLLPVVVLASLWGSTVRPATSAVGAAFWAIGALLLVATTQFLNGLLRAVWDRHAGRVLGAAGLLAVVVAGGSWTGGQLLQSASAGLFGGLAAGRILPMTLLFAGTAALAVAAHRTLRGRLYSVLGNTEPSRTQSTGIFRGAGRGWGCVVSLALLDLRLILRNKRPRQMLLGALLLEAVFLFQVVTTTGGEAPPPVLDAFITVTFSIVLTGFLGFQYVGFVYAWHGAHFDGLLARAVRPRTLVRSQYATFCVLSVAGTAVVLPVAGGLRPSMIVPMGALLIYNLGVVPSFFLGLGVWGREAVALDQSAFFNYQGNTTTTFAGGFVGMLVAMTLPVGLWVGLGRSVALVTVLALGALGVALSPVWTREIGRLLCRQRHAMASGFRDE